ncbi:MAG: GtrA family protein [Verrucomicrobia bacterium]|nr:GtrA family protein [Verrucomicrobiota bacterium]
MQLSLNSSWRRLFGRYARFCVVGGSGVAVDMALIWLLADPRLLGWNLTLSKVIAAEVAIVNNFLWNDQWTFRRCAAGGWKARGGRFAKFNVICTAGIGWSVLLLNLQVYGWHWNVYLSNFIAIVLVSVWNFWLNARFGWKAKELAGV